jgi:hypothetical protein
MQILAEWIGYIVIIIGLSVVALFFVMKISDYIPTPRKWLYKKLDKLAKNEPEIFLNMMIYFKRKYKLKHKEVSV